MMKKLKLRALAIAAAMATVAGAAHADLTPAPAGNSSFAMVAFNVVTNSYYVRDLGYTLNTFLPSSITTLAGDGGVTGDKTPEFGANITFSSDANWSSWIAGQNLADIRWTVAAGDAASANASQGVARALVALSTTPSVTITNNVVRGSVASSSGVSGLAGQNNPMGASTTGATVIPSVLSNNGFGAETLSLLDTASSLFYYVATASTGASTTAAIATQFGNSAGFATLTLTAAGLLTYALAPASVGAVPLPAAAWLMATGLLGIGSRVRRRQQAA